MNVLPFRLLLVSCVVVLAGSFTSSAAAQTTTASGKTLQAGSARPGDVSSMDAIMEAVYDVISGPRGQKRDWARMHSLFAPGARLIPARTDKNGVTEARMLSVDDYIRIGGPYLEKEGFFERETHRTVERYGAIAQVFSTYESRHAAADAKPFERGINSFQLLFDGHRWWVVTIYWQGERSDLPIPKRYGG